MFQNLKNHFTNREIVVLLLSFILEIISFLVFIVSLFFNPNLWMLGLTALCHFLNIYIVNYTECSFSEKINNFEKECTNHDYR